MKLWRFVCLFLLLQLLIFLKFVTTFDNSDVEESLMDLDISELLRLKRSFLHMEEEGCFQTNASQEHEENRAPEIQEDIAKPKPEGDTCVSQNCLRPMAMALTSVPRGYYSHSGHHHSHPSWHPQPEEKQSKLTTLFNITISSLAFLAFGGYLLCLIIHAIKSKGATYFYPVTTTSSTAVDGDGGVRRIKVYRRGRREAIQQPFAQNFGENFEQLGSTLMKFQQYFLTSFVCERLKSELP